MKNISTQEAFKAPAAISLPIQRRIRFRKASPRGFGDRYNTWAWAMYWWKGKLYVGTNRAFYCAERAAIANGLPLVAKLPLARYPPPDPDVGCPPDSTDLPLRAEIWRWIPETDTWERVYQAPEDVPNPRSPGKYVARDVGYRGMASFVESDGTEALYVSGVSSKFMYGPMPPPRLLRSTDGVTFESVPQEPGTFLGELDAATIRTIVEYKGRFFIGAGKIHGEGAVLESSHPAGGNDHFKQVTPPGMDVLEMATFNGHLYVGLRDPQRGYAVLRTDATGAPPYHFTSVVPAGACHQKPSLSVISMQVYKGRLYVGTDKPAELIRINPDDTWNVVVGAPRQTPDGWKYPLSGLEAGFYNWLNGHIWRMSVYNDRLYIGTMKMSTHFRTFSNALPVLEPNFGFDLYETADGWHYTPITTNGFDDKFDFGIRSFAVAPDGLFFGTANSWYGLQIWQGKYEEPDLSESGAIVSGGSAAEARAGEASRLSVPSQAMSDCWSPEHLEVENGDGSAVLFWEATTGRQRYRIWRAAINDQRPAVDSNKLFTFIRWLVRVVRYFKPFLYFPPLPGQMWIPEAYKEIGSTEQFHYEDKTVETGRRYLYYVRAESQHGQLSESSNVVTVPALTPPITFAGLSERLDSLMNGDHVAPAETVQRCRTGFDKARHYLELYDLEGVDNVLQKLIDQLAVTTQETTRALALEDIYILLLKLRRRVALSQIGVIQPEKL